MAVIVSPFQCCCFCCSVQLVHWYCLIVSFRSEFQEIQGGKTAFTTAKKYIQEIVKDLGLDYAKIEEAIDESTYNGKIEKHKSTGSSVGVRGTPAIYINGKVLKVNWVERTPDGFFKGKPEVLYPIIEEELKKQSK